MGYVLLAAGLGCSLWCLVYSLGVWTVLSSARLTNIEETYRDDWPSLSVVFAARDEEMEIGASLRALMSLDYPSLEIVAVNDRSTDSTGRIIDEMAQRDRRIKPVHIDTLPEGWLGKVYALDRGFRESGGEWVLFTDADVKLAPDTLSKALSYAHEMDAEHVVLFP